jgi:hypothetical protein
VHEEEAKEEWATEEVEEEHVEWGLDEVEGEQHADPLVLSMGEVPVSMESVKVEVMVKVEVEAGKFELLKSEGWPAVVEDAREDEDIVPI